MAKIHTKILSEAEIQAIHEASLSILKKTGIMIHHDEVLKLVGEAGAGVNKDSKIAHMPEQLVMDCITKAGKRYILHGRDLQCTARFGYGDLVLMSSPGQFGWIDSQTGRLRSATIKDARDAICLGDALPNINIVGSMAHPEEIS